MSLYNITVDPLFIGCNGWKSDHQMFFFEEYYSAMCKAFMIRYNERVAYSNPYDRYKYQEMYHLFDGFKDYMEKTNKAINGVNFPGGGYHPFTEYTIPDSCIKVWRFEDVRTDWLKINVVLMIALVDISHITDPVIRDKIFTEHNAYINRLCNHKDHKAFYNKLKSLYYSCMYTRDNINIVALTSQVAYLIYK